MFFRSDRYDRDVMKRFRLKNVRFIRGSSSLGGNIRESALTVMYCR